MYNHSADENSGDNMRAGDQSWLDDRFSQDNASANNVRDSTSNKWAQKEHSVASLNNSKSKSNNGGNEIIPERRRKYLSGNEESYATQP